jgi:hypothetical protein
MKQLVTMSLAVCALIGCGTSNNALELKAERIEDYRRLDIPPPAAEQAPERFSDTLFGFSFARPDAQVDQFYSEWKMTYAGSPARGVFVLGSYEFDNTLPKVVLKASIAGQSTNFEETLAKFQQRFTAESGLVSFERVTIDGHPAAIAQFRMINPIDTFTIYQCLIPDTLRSVSLIGYAPEREFKTFKASFRKAMMSTKLTEVKWRPNERKAGGGGC